MNDKLNYMCLKRGVSLILGHGVVDHAALLFPDIISAELLSIFENHKTSLQTAVPPWCVTPTLNLAVAMTFKKVKFSHTQYRALGPKLIPVYRCTGLFKSSPGGRLPLLSARPNKVTFPADERHRPSTSTKLCCLVTEAHRCEQLAQGCYAV